VGRSGIGKSSFIDSFCDKKWDQLPTIREKTEAMKIHTYEETTDHSIVDISLIDFPGFQETNIQDYIDNVKKIILEGYENKVNNSSKEKKNGNGHKNGNGNSTIKSATNNSQDERIHCCIFFISGPWVN
jgi:septin family protein